MSSGGKMKPIAILVDNLRLVCSENSGEPSSSQTETGYSQCSIINTAILKNQKNSYKETLGKQHKKLQRLGN